MISKGSQTMTDVGTPPAPSQRPALSILLDLQFRQLLTVRLAPFVYVALVVLTGVLCALLVVAGFVTSPWWGVLALAAAPVLFLGGVVAARVAVEFTLAVFEMLDCVEHMREVVDGVAGRTEEIAGSLPRLSFWRRHPESRTES